MALRLKRTDLLLAAVGAAIFLGGCTQGGSLGQAPLSTSAPGVSQTGTQTVRTRVQQLRADQAALAGGIAKQQEQLNATRGQISSDASTYNGLMSSITARLQAGTTPGNPELVAQWNDAQARLDAITLSVGSLNSLASQVTTQASVAGYLLDNVRATFAVGGAVEDDHRNLRAIEGDTTRSIQDVDRLISDLNAEISRQNGYLARERSNLAALSYGIALGRMGAPGLQRQPMPGGGMPRRVVLGPQATGAPTQLSALPQ
jgi:TolA-binding protein